MNEKNYIRYLLRRLQGYKHHSTVKEDKGTIIVLTNESLNKVAYFTGVKVTNEEPVYSKKLADSQISEVNEMGKCKTKKGKK